MARQVDDVRKRAIEIIEKALRPVLEGDGRVTPRSEAQVQKAVDLLRTQRGDRSLLKSAEFLSCAMFEMSGYLRQGRVNAYQSKELRVRKVYAATLSECGSHACKA